MNSLQFVGSPPHYFFITLLDKIYFTLIIQKLLVTTKGKLQENALISLLRYNKFK
jgi:hypothetical protein